MDELTPLITQQMLDDIGVEWDPYVQEIDRRFIRKFAEAVGDSNPLWQREVEARRTGYGGIIAPPTFHVALDPFWRFGEPIPRWEFPMPEKSGAHASDSVEIFEPIRPGDTITATARIVDIFERQGKTGRLLFAVREVTYVNQFDQTVAKSRSSSVKVF